jgi:hypothetical protein
MIITPVLPSVFLFSGPDAIDYSYLDPGTGSIIIQVVIGVAVGGLATIGIFWTRVRTFLKKLLSRNKQDNRIDEQ